MTQPEKPGSIPESDRDPSAVEAAAAEGPETEPEPEPEPWTPERVSEWNSYYDVYVMLGVLLLVFLASANRITHSSIWNQLQVGRVIASTGAPVTTDPFSFSEEGKPWVNVPWLFDLSHALIYKFAFDMAPVDTTDPVGSTAKADQVAAGTLIALDAFLRLLTAFFLMRIRRSGPGLWWSAVCVTLALGAMVNPAGLGLGGIAGPGLVTPSTPGLLLIALELWLLHRAATAGSRGSAFALVPLFALWANVDDSFLIGLMILGAVAIGQVRKSSRSDLGTNALTLPLGLGVLAASALACLANPSTIGVYPASMAPFLGLLRPATDEVTLDQLSYFGQGIRQEGQAGSAWTVLLFYYLTLCASGFFSFWLNRRRFSLSRFLVYALMVVLWGLLIRFSPEFAVVWAVTMALNGQEWYLDTFGERGRIGTGWSLWSVGLRAVTIVAVFVCVAKALTGFGTTAGEPQFGFGYEPGDFAFEAADYLKTAPIQGAVLNTTVSQGDALIWRAHPERKTYIDGRPNLFPPEVLNRIQEVRRALSEDDDARWKPLLDEYKVSAVMIEASRSPNTYRVLSQSPRWYLFYDDGNVLIFGRADAPAADVAYFKANLLDPAALAYKRPKPTPSAERPPTPITSIDRIFQSRSLMRPQPHTEAARRWLSPPSADPAEPVLPDPARCLMAIREARTALASKPDDTQAYRLLAAAYRTLMIQESALLSGVALTNANAELIRSSPPRADLLRMRFRQRATALTYAIQTTPPPKSPQARRELQALNLELFQLYASVNFFDLARDRLAAVLEGSTASDFAPEVRAQMTRDLGQFNDQVKQVQTQLTDLSVESQPSPTRLAEFAMSSGAPGLALQQLEEADRTGTTPALVKPQLLDLYCETGQPEKAVEMITGQVEDPSFGAEPGMSAMRQGRAYFLLGNAVYAATLWEQFAIPRLREERSVRALGSTQALLRGDAKSATASYLAMPDKIAVQATWEFEAGLCRLEGGEPLLAGEHFTRSLTLSPRLAVRPVMAYYLEQLGKPVPPEDPAAAAATAAEPAKPAAAEAAKPAPTKPDAEVKDKDKPLPKEAPAAPKTDDKAK